jgi:pantetheine-phosphate adenylyltransferase
MTRIALYPGSFDPLTNGHQNIIERSLRLCDRLVVAVSVNPSKSAMFTVEERLALIREVFADEPRIELTTFSGLLVEFARTIEATMLIRGLRAVADFEYEYQMSSMNRKLVPSIETVFLMAEPGSFFVSSRLVKEVALLGGDLTGVVPEKVRTRLTERVAELTSSRR